MDRGYSYYGEVRLGHSFFLGPIGLGNWPHMLYNGPHLSPWDVLSHGTLCPLRRFVLGSFRPWNVLSLGTLCPLRRFVLGSFRPWNNVPWDVLSLGMLVPGTFCPWNNVPWDVLSLGMLVSGTFCLGTLYATFCMCIQNTVCMNLLYNFFLLGQFYKADK